MERDAAHSRALMRLETRYEINFHGCSFTRRNRKQHGERGFKKFACTSRKAELV